jgi:NAD(P)-dependent dehydrogenase (short-subunit alcohol dehydrogenase family)
MTDIRPADPAICIVPTVPERAAMANLSDSRLTTEIGDALEDVLAHVQSALDLLHDGGRLVFLLPHAPLMGAPGSAAASAVANGVLSMARTLAIELARDRIGVNVLAVDAEQPDGDALAVQLRALLGSGGQGITGQEIYLTAGSELGRLRP